jgi:hypothetical protein
MLKEKATRFRETQQTAVAVKQRHAEFLFVLLNSEGSRAVRHMSLLGRTGDIPLVGDRHDVAEMTQLHFVPSEHQWRLN